MSNDSVRQDPERTPALTVIENNMWGARSRTSVAKLSAALVGIWLAHNIATTSADPLDAGAKVTTAIVVVFSLIVIGVEIRRLVALVQSRERHVFSSRYLLACGGLLAAVTIVTSEFGASGHQRKLDVATDATSYIFEVAKELFNELWNGTPIRKLGVRVSDLHENTYYQVSLFTDFDFERHKQIDSFVDDLRKKYGKGTIQRASFLHSGMSPVTGGIGEDGYPVMTSVL